MFTAIIQIFDLIKLNQLGLFLPFFLISWGLYISKLIRAKYHKPPIIYKSKAKIPSFSIIIPVVDEPLDVWESNLKNLRMAIAPFKKKEVLVVANGGNGIEEARIAEELGFKTLRIKEASKRRAIFEGAKRVKNEVTFILDSDTQVGHIAIHNLLAVLANNPEVGGVTPRHHVVRYSSAKDTKPNYIRVISDWLEDIRFNEVLKGQNGAVGCLPGRLLAIRTKYLKEASKELVEQKFLGSACISGDDRFLTSWLLKRGIKTIYEQNAQVWTQAPDTLLGFIKQRLRWSRTSLRETILSLNWIFKYPFTAITTIANVVFRWWFFTIIVFAFLTLIGVIKRDHYFDLTTLQLILGTLGGFLISGFFKQLRHLIAYPEDKKYFLPFLFITTFILTPVEWYGNLTIKESNWMTRKLDK